MKRLRKGTKESGVLKQRWRTASADAGPSESAWSERERVTKSHLAQLIKGDRQSARLTEKVLAFIGEREALLAKRLNGVAA